MVARVATGCSLGREQAFLGGESGVLSPLLHFGEWLFTSQECSRAREQPFAPGERDPGAPLDLSDRVGQCEGVTDPNDAKIDLRLPAAQLDALRAGWDEASRQAEAAGYPAPTFAAFVRLVLTAGLDALAKRRKARK